MTTLSHENKTTERPWGGFTIFSLNEPVTVKILSINPHEACSLQSHKERSESWRVISGDGVITINNSRTNIIPGADYEVPIGSTHRIEAGEQTVVILEVSRGHFDENDIIRFEDKYGRENVG